MTLNNSEVEILLVEDSEKDIELTLHALRAENLGNQIHVARDGEEALQFLAAQENELAAGRGILPKLILLDLKLPKVDGLQELRQIKSNPITQFIPVVVLDLFQGRRRYGSQLPVGGKQLPAKAREVRAVPKIGQGSRAVLAPH